MKCPFDNNLPPKLAVTLNYLEGDDGIVVEHIKEKFSSDTPDMERIPYSRCFSSKIMDKL